MPSEHATVFRLAVPFALALATGLVPFAEAQPKLSAETEEALARFRAGEPDAFEALSRAHEYREVAALMSDVLGESDHRLHNNACLTLEGLVQAHHDLVLPVEPVLDCLSHRVFTCQQKSAQVVRDSLEVRKDWLKGHEEEAARRLIPLTASQRSRVYEAALACLRPLTGENIGRDPLRWAAWFEKRYKKKLDLSDCLYEIVAVVDTRDGFSMNGEKLTRSELRKKLEELQAAARKHHLDLGVVGVLHEDALASGDTEKVMAAAQDVIEILTQIGIHDATFAPPEDTFLPPVKELLAAPAKK